MSTLSKRKPTSRQYALLGDFSSPAEFAGLPLKQGLVAVKAFLRNGKLVQGYKRKDLLNIAGRAIMDTPSVTAIEGLVDHVVNTRSLPSNAQIGGALKVIAKDAASSPRRFVREGLAREQVVRDVYRAVTRQPAPSRLMVAAQASQKADAALKTWLRKNPGVIENAFVAVAGTSTSIAGGMVAGPVGGLAGDLAGAAIVRKGILDVNAVRAAKIKLIGDEAFRQAGILEKFKMFKTQTLSELDQLARAGDAPTTRLKDATEWAIGNSVAIAGSSIPIPFKGAAAAIGYGDRVTAAIQAIQAGGDRKVILQQLALDVGALPERALRAGRLRERRFRNRVNRQLRKKLGNE